MLVLAVVLMGAGVAASAPGNGAAPHIFTDGGLTLQLTSSMSGVTFSGDTLVCPPVLITTSSGADLTACEFTISSVGAVAPAWLVVTMTASGISPAEVSAHKFAIAPQPGPLVYLETTPQTLYTFAGAQLPVTVDPGVTWGADAGTRLDDSDLGSSIVVTYTVIAESLQGATASPTVAPTATPVAAATAFESIGGATGAPVQTVTPPPTGSASHSSSNNSVPLFALLICFLLAGLGLLAIQAQRRNVRR
jgi:hypothetical protein